MGYEKLEPCPHCGQSRFARVREYPWANEGEPDLRWGYHVICDASGFEDSANRGCGAASGWGETREDAIAAWNRRHPSRDAVIDQCIAEIEAFCNWGDYKREELTDNYGKPRFDLMHDIIAQLRLLQGPSLEEKSNG